MRSSCRGCRPIWASGRKLALRPVKQDDIRDVVSLGVDQHKRNAFDQLGGPIREHSVARLSESGSRTCRACSRSSPPWSDRAAGTCRGWVRNASRSLIAGVGTCFSKPSGMSDFLEAAIWSMSSRRMACRFPSASISSTEVFDSEANSPLITRPSVVATVVLDEVALDAPARVEDVDQELVARNGGHPGEVGADLAPFAIVAVAFGALLLENQLACAGSPPSSSSGVQSVDDQLPIGIGEPAAPGPAASWHARRCRD